MSSPARIVTTRVPRLAEAAVERARLSVVPRARARAARVPFVTLVSLLLLGGVIGLLLFNTSMQQSAFTATALEKQATVLSAREEGLRSELEDLRDPQAIAVVAQRLGMVLPGAPLLLDLADGTVLGDPAAATAGSAVQLNPPVPGLPAALNPQPEVRIVRPPEGVLAGQDGAGQDAGGQDAGGQDDAAQNGGGRDRGGDRADNRGRDTGSGSTTRGRRGGRNNTSQQSQQPQ
ncbi:MAG: hypothetical protein F2667_01835 [Actinobacteria bacterium]|uniref:Unannotated protein n=1 Tax=freshwater metagenome TaxID=449393 RepID=A0A6J6NZ49_9ZZZZ|nr:hypothetical protein [Actinomycetota bacterium]